MPLEPSCPWAIPSRRTTWTSGSWPAARSTLRAAGFALQAGGEELLPDEVVAAGIVRQVATVRATRGQESVDLITWLRTLDFEELWRGQRSFTVRGAPVRTAPLEAILRSKQLAFRMKDRMFLEQFKEVITEALELERRRKERGKPPA